MKTYKLLFSYLKDYKKETYLTWLFVLIESACEVLLAFFMQDLIDAVQPPNKLQPDINNIYKYAIIIACFAILAAFTGIMAGYFAAGASAGFSKNLRKAMYDHIQEYSFKNIDKFSTPSIVTRTTTDVTNIQNAFMMVIRTVIRAPFLMIFALIMCFVTQWRLAWIFLIIIPILLFLLLFIAGHVHPIFVKVFDTYDDLNRDVQENVDGIRVVKSFNRAEYHEKQFNKTSDFIYKNFVKAESRLAFNSPIMNAAVDSAIIVIAYFGSWMIINYGDSTDWFTTGSLTTLITYVMMILNSLMMISMVYVQIIVSRNSAERIAEIIKEVPDITSPNNAIETVANGDVDYDDVTFSYVKGKPVLTDINLHIKSGETVGIIGSTGSSKTTLVSLMDRLYDVDSGSVKIASHDVKEYDLVSLRDSVAIVLQKNTLFTGTIRSNLLWGNKNATDDEIWAACDLAQASDFIKKLPNGLDSPISEGGTNVSGGQKQRLCIARALLKNPKILILDDSTSACDTHTDALIREGLSTVRKDITKFIIAQRVLSIKDCNIIIVMDKGKIIAQGNNDELMNTCPVYKELYESQLGGDFDAAN